MGRNSAGVKAGTNDGGGQYKGKISRVGSLVEMKDKAMYKATKEAISRYHAVMGVRQRNVKLTADEIKVIKQQLNGEIEVWNATDEQQKLLTGVIDKAEALMEETDAYDDLDNYMEGGLVAWFYDKYKAQEQA
jgi:hypothetical protein